MSSVDIRASASVPDGRGHLPHRISRLVASYAVAIVAVVGTLGLKALIPQLGELHPFVLLPVGIAIAAWYGGLGPAVSATIASIIATDILFIPPAAIGIDTDVSGLLALLVEGVLISALTVALRDARHRANGAALAAEAARRETTLALQLREELISLWTAKLRGPVSDFATTLDEARLAHRDQDHARVGTALEQLRLGAGVMQRTVHQWYDVHRADPAREPLIPPE